MQTALGDVYRLYFPTLPTGPDPALYTLGIGAAGLAIALCALFLSELLALDGFRQRRLPVHLRVLESTLGECSGDLRLLALTLFLQNDASRSRTVFRVHAGTGTDQVRVRFLGGREHLEERQEAGRLLLEWTPTSQPNNPLSITVPEGDVLSFPLDLPPYGSKTGRVLFVCESPCSGLPQPSALTLRVEDVTGRALARAETAVPV